MRDTKFRLFNKHDKKMYIYDPKWGNFGQGGGWVGGVLLEDYEREGRTFAPSNQWQLEPEGCEWMEYIGLLDKNDKEIYEGDIVDLYKNQGEALFCRTLTTVIKWSETGLNWNIWPPHNDNEFWKVISNIYENPELLNNGVTA